MLLGLQQKTACRQIDNFEFEMSTTCHRNQLRKLYFELSYVF